MKKSAIVLSAFALALTVGCSDKTKTEFASAPAAPAAPAAPQKAAFSNEVPAEIKGFPFELGGKCAIDVINKTTEGEVVAINRADGLTVDGWAVDEKNGAVPAAAVLQLAKGDERYFAVLNRHSGREDLTKALGKAEFANGGYSATVDIAALPAGQYDILVIQKGVDKNLVCSTYRKLDLQG